MVTKAGTSLAESDDFGVRSGVGEGEVLVPAAADDCAFVEDDCPYRDFAGFQCALGGSEGLFHPEFVSGRRELVLVRQVTWLLPPLGLLGSFVTRGSALGLIFRRSAG